MAITLLSPRFGMTAYSRPVPVTTDSELAKLGWAFQKFIFSNPPGTDSLSMRLVFEPVPHKPEHYWITITHRTQPGHPDEKKVIRLWERKYSPAPKRLKQTNFTLRKTRCFSLRPDQSR
jgi:hypothetical protein